VLVEQPANHECERVPAEQLVGGGALGDAQLWHDGTWRPATAEARAHPCHTWPSWESRLARHGASRGSRDRRAKGQIPDEVSMQARKPERGNP